MESKDKRNLNELLNVLRRQAYSKTKSCYITECDKKPIAAHSIAKSRLLKKISDRGEVLQYGKTIDTTSSLSLCPIGKSIATTFPGFCGDHDRTIFNIIDDSDYSPGNKTQEFLFAFRATAREYTVRKAVDSLLFEIIKDLKNRHTETISKYGFKPENFNLKFLSDFYIAFHTGTEDLEEDRRILIVNYNKKRFWKITTELIELDAEYPIVASSNFNLEFDPNGKLINDFRDLKNTMRPTFLTIFPQNRKTYVIFSWMHKDNNYYLGLKGINSLPMEQKLIIVSNLLTAYVENFAVNPSYWNNTPDEMKAKFLSYAGASMSYDIVPFIIDNNLNIFKTRIE